MKIKPLSKEQLIISLDRLTRFKEPEEKYLRVFKELILNNLIEPKFKKSDLDRMEYEIIRDFAVSIINLEFGECKDFIINKKLSDYENYLFKISPETQILLDNKINYKEIVKVLPKNIPNNLKILNNNFYEIKKIIICEGITEEILLPKFAKVCGFDFEKEGIHIVSAGGKNQVVKYFYKYSEILRIPIFILLDNDAKENLEQIRPKLRAIDKIHLVKSGEFEDLLSKPLIIKTLNYETKNISLNTIEGLETAESTVEFLENFFKHRGLHEFKKADFALSVNKNISGLKDVSDEIKEIINELR